jgi:aminoglycoside/choline kinase family phosphotransferase
MWRYLDRCLATTSELKPLKAWLDRYVPVDRRI